MLQIAVIWHGTIIGYRLQRRRRKITVGPNKRATFITPSIRGAKRFVLLTPRKNGYVLNLAPELKASSTSAARRWPWRRQLVGRRHGPRRSRQADL